MTGLFLSNDSFINIHCMHLVKIICALYMHNHYCMCGVWIFVHFEQKKVGPNVVSFGQGAEAS